MKCGQKMSNVVKVKQFYHEEWYDVIDEDPDCDFESGEYLGVNDMIKLSDGRWYRKNECLYRGIDGVEKRI
jgi:hypothetical protein